MMMEIVPVEAADKKKSAASAQCSYWGRHVTSGKIPTFFALVDVFMGQMCHHWSALRKPFMQKKPADESGLNLLSVRRIEETGA